MGPLTIIYFLHNFPNWNCWIFQFLFGGPFSFELYKIDCIMKYTNTDPFVIVTVNCVLPHTDQYAEGIGRRNSSKRAIADLRLGLRDNGDRLYGLSHRV